MKWNEMALNKDFLFLSLLFLLVTHFPLSRLLFSCMLFSNSIQDIAILFNLIIILLMLFNTFVFQVGLVAVLLERFRALLMLSALYLTFSIILHSWLMVRAVCKQMGRYILKSLWIDFKLLFFYVMYYAIFIKNTWRGKILQIWQNKLNIWLIE